MIHYTTFSAGNWMLRLPTNCGHLKWQLMLFQN